MNLWNWFRVIFGIMLITTAGIIVLIKWHKEIDAETTWVYGCTALPNGNLPVLNPILIYCGFFPITFDASPSFPLLAACPY